MNLAQVLRVEAKHSGAENIFWFNFNAFREFEGRTADVLVVLVEKGMKKML